MLFFKWNNYDVPLDNVLTFFKRGWDEVRRDVIASPSSRSTRVKSAETFWLTFMKKVC